MSTEEETQIPLKIWVNKARNKVLFAEADYRFVDILFSFLTLPMGTIIRLIGESSDSELSIGSFNSLYQSLTDLPVECFWTEEECKAVLLNPMNSSNEYCSKLKLNVEDTSSTKYFRCFSTCGVTSICSSAECRCRRPLSKEIDRKSYSNSNYRKEGVFVTKLSSFIITDDLQVKPNLIGSSIKMLIDMGITDMTSIEEMIINIGLQQALNLLRTALFSTHPLTDLFLQKAQSANELVRCLSGNTSLPIISEVTSCIASNIKNINAKVFVRKSYGNLLFVQAGGDFIDFLFSFITMPLGSVEWLLSGSTNVAPSIDNLYNSISSLNVSQYFESQYIKERLLKPPMATQYQTENKIFSITSSISYKYFSDHSFVLKDPRCKGEFVRGAAMFIVTDDLIVTPLSSVSAISHLNNSKIPLYDIQEYDVSIGTEEALEILKASLTSSSALSQGLKHQLPKRQTY